MGAVPSKQYDGSRQRYALSLFPAVTTTSCDAPPPPPPPISGGGGSAPPPPPPSTSETSDAAPKEKEDDIAAAAAQAPAFVNPGPYEMAGQDVKRLVMLDTYDGFRCDINKQLSPQMAVVHSFWLGTTMLQDKNYSYSWLTQVADESSMCMARVDSSRLSTDGRLQKMLLGGLGIFKLQLGLSPEGQTDQAMAELDINGLSFAANLKYGSAGGAILYGLNYHQAITDRLSMGGEGMYVAASQNLMANYMLKYSMPAKGDDDDDGGDILDKAMGTKSAPPPSWNARPSSTVCAQLNPSQGTLTVGYRRIVTPKRVTLGAELTCGMQEPLGSVLVGAEFQFARSNLKVCVDGNLKIQSLVETKLGKEPGQPSLTLSADVDHLSGNMKFGYGLSMDG